MLTCDPWAMAMKALQFLEGIKPISSGGAMELQFRRVIPYKFERHFGVDLFRLTAKVAPLI